MRTAYCLMVVLALFILGATKTYGESVNYRDYKQKSGETRDERDDRVKDLMDRKAKEKADAEREKEQDKQIEQNRKDQEDRELERERKAKEREKQLEKDGWKNRNKNKS